MKRDHLFRSYRKHLNTSLLLSFLGAGVPVVMAVVKIPVFSRLFTPAEWGIYSLVAVSFSFANMLLFSWQMSCVWRFYTEYAQRNSCEQLGHYLRGTAVWAGLLLLLASGVWCVCMPTLWPYIATAFLQTILMQRVALLLVVLQVEQQRRLWASASAAFAFVSVSLAVYFCAVCNLSVYGIFIASAAVYAVILLTLQRTVVIKQFYLLPLSWNPTILFRSQNAGLLRYGMLAIAIELTFTILTIADRYIIAGYENASSVGLYSQSFTIAQFAILGGASIFFARYNPLLNRILSIKPLAYQKALPTITLRYCLVFFPIVVWLSLFSKPLTELLLAPAYRSARVVFFPVALAYFLYGLILLRENVALFAKQYRSLLVIYLVALVVSIASTLVAVWLWGYVAAAWTTLLAFFILFVRYNPLLSLRRVHWRMLLRMIFVLILQVVLYRLFALQSWWTLGMELGVFVFVYYVLLFMSGSAKFKW